MTKEASTKFHFSPRTNRAQEIQWREWSDEAFQEAQGQGKPILLALSAVWCHWCHVMDETSYSDEQVIDYINENFVPIRVDNDQRPDINARYNMGGWPTTAFLTPDGEVLAGATYVPPEQMRQALSQVAGYQKDNREEIARKVEELRQRRAAVAAAVDRAPLTKEIFDKVVRGIIENYDPVFGGFGEAPKFPHSDSIDLVLYAYRKRRDPDLLHIARKTLEMMAQGGIFDHEWGGFFRYATQRDWAEPHYEKMLEDNSNLLRNLLDLYRASSDEAHASVALRVVDYMDGKLRDHSPDGGFFFGSQDADEEFYKLPAAEREKVSEPYIDRTCYTSWNAMAASTFLQASWVLSRPEIGEWGTQALNYLWQNCRQPGKGMYRFYDGTPQVLGLLGDQAYTARALLDAYEVTADSLYLERAEELAALLLERFADEEGGFFDTWEETESLGRLRERQKLLPENAVCAEVLIRLHAFTRKATYREVAQATLENFAPNYHLLGQFGASYGKAVDMFLSGLAEVNVVGDLQAQATRLLRAAALALDVPARSVQFLNPADSERLAALALPAEPAPAAYVCVGTMCSAPVSRPEELQETVRNMQNASVRTLLGGQG